MIHSSRLSFLFPIVFAVGCGSGLSAVNNPRNLLGLGPAPVVLSSDGGALVAGDLGAAGSYVILAKAAISTTSGTTITGNMGISPAAASYITGFGTLPIDSSGLFSTSAMVTGNIYAPGYAAPTPNNLTTAIGSMQTAYTDAAGRTPPDFSELATGNLGGLTLAPGLYAWSTDVTIPTSVTISGGANDVWIFQTTGNIVMSAAKNVVLAGGAQAKNIFWEVAGQVTLGTTAHFEGTILCKTAIVLQTGASLNGRAYAQTALTLDATTVVQK